MMVGGGWEAPGPTSRARTVFRLQSASRYGRPIARRVFYALSRICKSGEQPTMIDQEDQVILSEDKARWEKPELRRLEAGAAEGAGGPGTDNVVFS